MQYFGISEEELENMTSEDETDDETDSDGRCVITTLNREMPRKTLRQRFHGAQFGEK